MDESRERPPITPTRNRLWRWENIDADGLCEPYLRRFVVWKLPFKLGTCYLHHFLGDDWTRDPHDHPKWFLSIGLWGEYVEQVYNGGSYRMVHYKAPWVRFFPATHVHRLMISNTERKNCWTLVITGPARRQWGFHILHLKKFVPYLEYFEKYGSKRKDC